MAAGQRDEKGEDKLRERLSKCAGHQGVYARPRRLCRRLTVGRAIDEKSGYSPDPWVMAAAWIANGVRGPSVVRTMVVRVLRRVKSQ
jgi:hypothetical protein